MAAKTEVKNRSIRISDPLKEECSLGNYDLTESRELGKGSFCEVYTVRLKTTKRVYACRRVDMRKLIRIRKNIEFEIEVMKDCSYLDGFVEFVERFEHECNLYMIVEFCAGGDLIDLLEFVGGAIPERYAKFYFAQISSAVHAFHLKGYFHRDLKPDNILINGEGHVRITDFNLSIRKKLGFNYHKPVGTHCWRSPEMFKGSYGVDHDWWCVGGILYEMIYGRAPFDIENNRQILADQIINLNYKQYRTSLGIQVELFNRVWPDIEVKKNKLPVSSECRDFIRRVLCYQESRLSFPEMRNHAFLENLNWNGIWSRNPPIIPSLYPAYRIKR